jgi:hypothetical protein
MASSPRTQEREERRNRIRTLVIASVASAAAAAITSQLWIAGTWIAAALTPVLVTLLSELLHPPTEKLAQALTTDSTGLLADAAGAAPPPPPSADPLPKRAPEEPGSGPEPPAPPRAADEPLPSGAPGPVHVYRQPPRRPPRRKIAIGAVLGTAAIATVIGVTLLTATELIAGESIGKSDRRTSIGIGGKKSRDDRQQQDQDQQRTTPDRTTTEETTTQETTTETTPTEETAPPEETTPTETTPLPQETETAPAP